MAALSESPALEPVRRRFVWLLPHEHGAYGQLLFPSLTALILRPSTAGMWLATAFVLVFVLHESLLILLGQRGPRARQQHARRAAWHCSALTAAFVPAFALAWYRMNADARWSLLLPGGLALLLSALILQRRERTTAGELNAAAALSSCSVPILLAGNMSRPAAAACWLVWLITLLAATLSVRGIIAWARLRRATLLRAASGLSLAGMALLAALARRLNLPANLWLILLPAALLTVRFLRRPPSPKYLRRIGWSWMIASLTVSAALVFLLRS